MADLTGLVVVVTGGNGGIGLGMAKAVATAGADIVIWGRSGDKNREAEAELVTTGRRVLALECDVSDEQQVIDAFAASVEAMGKVDSLFANAGISGWSPLVDMTLAEWRRVMAVNLDGVFLSVREAARHLVARGEGGSLVGVSSTSTIHGAPGQEHYAASKAGVTAVMRSCAVELARHRIRCNTLLPGWTESGMLQADKASAKFVDNTVKRTPVRRWGVPADLGPAAVFLADPANLFHTGDQLVVDGGYTVF